MTGHHSNEFTQFLRKHLKSLRDDFCYEDISAFKQENNLDGVSVICDENLDKLSAQLKENIEQEAKKRPVIVFGKNQDQKFIDSIKLTGAVFSMAIVNDADVEVAREYYLQEKRGVIFMADVYIVGVDIKCG